MTPAVLTIEQPRRERSSPSRYKNLEISPAFKDDPTREVHYLTEEGKLMHKALETGNDSGLNEDQKRLVAMCREYIESVLPTGATRLYETKFPIIDEDYGYGDFIALHENRAWYIDYKFAATPQEPVETNPAAQAYVLGIFNTWPYLKRVSVAYLYPKLDQVSMCDYYRKDCARIENRIRAIKARAKNATPATCNYSDDTCGWCVYLSSCPTAAKALLPVATKYAESHALPLPALPDLSLVRDPKQWARLFAAVPVFEKLADSIKRHALEFRIQTGQEIPGTEVRTRSGKGQILNPTIAHEIAVQHGMKHEDFLRAVEVSAKQLLDIAGESAPRGEKGKASKALELALRDAGVYEPGEEYQYLARVKS